MRGRFGLSLGFPIRRNLPLLAFSLFALSFCSGGAQAQDVLVIPPANTPQSQPNSGGGVLLAPVHDHVERGSRATMGIFAQPQPVQPAQQANPSLNRKATVTQLLTEIPKPGRLDAKKLPPLSPNRDVMGLDTPLIAVAPSTKEEDADLDAAVATYQKSAANRPPYPDSHKPFSDFLQKYPTSAWADSIRTNLGLASKRQK